MDGTITPGSAVSPDLEDADHDDWNDVPESLRPRRKLPKWPFVLAAVIFAIVVGIVAAWPINLPYYALSPGPVNDVTDFISVDEPANTEGDLFFLTVSLQEVNVLEYVAAQLNPEVDLSPRENIRPAGTTQEQLRDQNLNLMEQSKQNAIYVALTELGYEVTFEGSGARVTAFTEVSAAEGVLESGDLIIAVDGTPVEFLDDAMSLLGGRAPGDTVELTIERPVDDPDVGFERQVVEITLIPYRALNEDDELIEDPDRGMVGVFLENGETEILFPVEIEIDSQNIGGPSAGMMFTLEIMNQLTEADLTAGYRIAGTGTIRQDGTVGAIGGIKQKVYGAIDAGAAYVLVPGGNYDEAIVAAGDDITVVRVVTIDDALDFLATL
jgi:PDZ domain-containing protein